MPDNNGARVNNVPNVDSTTPIVDTTKIVNLTDNLPKNEEIKKEQVQALTIPEELRFKTDKRTGLKSEKGWISKVLDEKGNLSIEKVIQQIDNLESLKGQKTIPFDFNNAKPEELKAHLDSTRPESHEVYDFVKGNVAEGTEELIQKLFHEISIPKPVAKMLMENYLSIEKSQMARATSQEGFDSELKKSFGENYKDIATKSGTALKSVLSPEDVEMLDSMPNIYLGLLYRGVNKLISDYAINETAIGQKINNGFKNVDTLESVTLEAEAAFKELQSFDRKPHSENQKKVALDRYRTAQNKLFALKGAK